jgi:hypothetical protein
MKRPNLTAFTGASRQRTHRCRGGGGSKDSAPGVPAIKPDFIIATFETAIHETGVRSPHFDLLADWASTHDALEHPLLTEHILLNQGIADTFASTSLRALAVDKRKRKTPRWSRSVIEEAAIPWKTRQTAKACCRNAAS